MDHIKSVPGSVDIEVLLYIYIYIYIGTAGEARRWICAGQGCVLITVILLKTRLDGSVGGKQ